MNESLPKLSLVVPTYNEAANIQLFLDSAHLALGSISHEIIIVDDNSPDQTWKIASDYAEVHPWVRVIRRMNERGLSSAVINGFEAAKGEYLGVMDADLSHDETILPKLIAALDQGNELAIGSRRVAGGGAVEWPWYRHLSSSFATGLAKIVLSLGISDPMSGYFVLRRSLYERSKSRLAPRGYKILVELCFKGRPERVAEIPFIFKNRKEGYSKLTGSVAKHYLQMLFILKFDSMVQRVRYAYHTGRYRKVKKWLKPGTVLDIGCGQPCETMQDGAFLRFLGYGRGVDIKQCAPGFDFTQGSLLDLPFEDKSFDNVVAMEVLEHVTEPHVAFQQISRVLKDDGVFVMSVPNETWLWEKIWHLWEDTFGYMWHETHCGTMHPDEWFKILTQYFVIESRRRHWHFDLVFRLRKQAAATPSGAKLQSSTKSTHQSPVTTRSTPHVH